MLAKLLQLAIAPGPLPLTLADAKEHCRVTTALDDAYISQLIRVAAGYAEERIGRTIGLQTWRMLLRAFPTGADAVIEIPKPPLIQVTAVEYKAVNAIVYTTLPTTEYYVVSAGEYGQIEPLESDAWPLTDDLWDAVRITFECGYLSAPLVPAQPRLDLPHRLRHALLVMVAEMYDRRADTSADTSVKMAGAFDALLRPSRARIW